MGLSVTELKSWQEFFGVLFWEHCCLGFSWMINSLFIVNSKLCNYADNNTLYPIWKNLIAVKSYPGCNFLTMHKWFHKNHMMLNPGKCLYMLIENMSHHDKIILNGVTLNPLQPGVAFLYPPKNIRKPKGFLFSGGIEKQHRAVIG